MAKIWVVACGSEDQWKEGWPFWVKDEYMAIGYGCNFPLIDEQGAELSSEEIIQKGGHSPNLVKIFAFQIQKGDYVVIKKGNSSILGLAKVMGDIEYSESWHQFRKVKWISTFDSPVDIQIDPSFTRAAVHSLGVECEPDQICNIIQSETENYLNRINTILTTFGLLKEVNVPLTNQDNNTQSKLPIYPLNQILFGPPGTGKTYNTVNKAIAIANPSFKLDQDREKIKAEFDRLMKEGQIVFTTFHQSMCYEDFIEGIKPETTPDDKRVIYEVKPGIFKNLCQAATTPNLIGFNAGYDQLIKDLSEIEAADRDTTEVKTIEIKTPTGKPFSISLNSNNNLSLHTGPNKIKQGTLTRENIQAQINGDVKFIGWNGYFEGVCNYLKENYNYSSTSENTAKNFVLIIDEINRGNVSQIFGELITLIEDDKRLGKDEALKVTLPYSKEEFGVPSNLYIIGTMNTADRSVEALDAALRRRFSFEEMPPKSDLIKKEGKLSKTEGILELDEFDDIDLPLLLNKINERLEKLLDKDHQIGHSYFISVASLDDLKLAFKNKIIPLLQEYFFGDYGKIGLVLGKGFVEKVPNESSFADFPDADTNDFSERPIFTIKTPTSNNEFVAAINSLLNKKTNG